MSRQPHIQSEALCHLRSPQLQRLQERSLVVSSSEYRIGSCIIVELIRHDDQIALLSVGVGLELVGWGVNAGAAGQEEEEFAGCVRVVGWFGYVAVDVVEFGDFAGGGLGG